MLSSFFYCYLKILKQGWYFVMRIIYNKEDSLIIFKQKEVEYNTREYNKQYQINLLYWDKLRKEEMEVNDQTIEKMILSKCDFWIRLINDKPYNQPNKIFVCLSFSYIGTNEFYGYINGFDGYISTDYYNQLIFKSNNQMECTMCGKYLAKHEIKYDYMGNEWCEECLEEETNREI